MNDMKPIHIIALAGSLFCLSSCITTTTRTTAPDGTITETTTTTPVPGFVEVGAIVTAKKILEEK